MLINFITELWTLQKCSTGGTGSKKRKTLTSGRFRSSWQHQHLTEATPKSPHLSTKSTIQSMQQKPARRKDAPLAKSFFPAKPHPEPPAADTHYPPQCSKTDKIHRAAVLRQLRKLKPYKAPGPDGIPNIVLTKCADILVDRLYHIYSAIYNKRLYYAPWKAFNTIVLRKPGKPNYEVPKAYRPIALINTLWKVLTAILAEQLTFFAEKYQLLPSNHFGGCPGCTTTDAMHILTHRIKSAWRKGQVAAVLFLDIEGAFPNAVPSKLIHNLKKRRVPEKLINFAAGMLDECVTTLKFDDYTSEPILIDNGIGQGDPMSMALYQFYNADPLDIPNAKHESAIAYVDDALLIATADSFESAHQTLANMMTRPKGVIDWSTSHNSPLEYSKLVLIDFAHQNNSKPRLQLHLPHKSISPVASAKYLGVIFDQNLKWNEQLAHVTEKGSKWSAQIRRAARPLWGITPKYARPCIYIWYMEEEVPLFPLSVPVSSRLSKASLSLRSVLHQSVALVTPQDCVKVQCGPTCQVAKPVQACVAGSTLSFPWLSVASSPPPRDRCSSPRT